MKNKRQIKAKELKKIRRVYHKKQKGICPILNLKVPLDDCVVDHSHSTNANNLRSNDAGLIRGIIHKQVNTFEGKVTNSFIRSGLHKMNVTLPEILRNLSYYIENPPLLKKQWVHPSEKQKPKNLKKTSITKLTKLFQEKYPNKKIPEVLIYKKSKRKKRKKNKILEKKLTKGLEKLYKEFNLEPEFKKG